VGVEQVDLREVPGAELANAIEARAATAQVELHLSHGPRMRAIRFDLGAVRPGRLLLVAHHLVIDGVSWRILLEDLEHAAAQIMAGQTPQLARRRHRSNSGRSDCRRTRNSAELKASFVTGSSSRGIWRDGSRATVRALESTGATGIPCTPGSRSTRPTRCSTRSPGVPHAD